MTSLFFPEGTASALAVRSGGYTVYPFAVCRVGGQSLDVLDGLGFPLSRRVQGVVEERRAEAAAVRERLLRGLHRAVGEAGGDRRRSLLRAARNLRRNGKLSEAQLRDLADGPVAALAADWREREDLAEAACRERQDTYARELVKSRGKLRSLAQDELFQKGLVLSSPTLFRGFRESLRRPLDRVPYNRAQRRLELGLVKYLSRAAAKTTPFSTLASTAPTVFADLPDGELIALPDGEVPRLSVHLNKLVYALLHRLLAASPELYPCFALTLNPSLETSAEGSTLLLAEAGGERSIRLGASPALERSVELIREAGGTLPYGVFVERLAAELGVDPADLRPRADRMVTAGLLELNTGIAEWEHRWAPLLLERLAASDHPGAEAVRALLERVRGILETFAAAPAGERADLLEDLTAEVEGFLASTAPYAGEDDGKSGVIRNHLKNLRRTPLFEDSSLTGPVRLAGEPLAPVWEALGGWIDWMLLLCPRWAFHANLRACYDRRFGGRPEASFPELYQVFYSEVFEGVLAFEKRRSEKSYEETFNPFGLEVLPRTVRANRELAAVLRRSWSKAGGDAESVHLERGDFDTSDLEPFAARGPYSAAVFAQLLPAALFGHDALVLEKPLVHAGRGRYFSRFLGAFDPRYAEELMASNRRCEDLIVAELSDDSEFSFNANLHPPLTDAEIGYPARLTGLDPERNVALAELVARPDPRHRHRLRLIHRPSGKEVLPVDLGFLSPLYRPPLFQVLQLFSPLGHHQLDLPWSYDATKTPDGQDVFYRPRLVFERRVVFARRAWRVRAGLLAELLAGAAPAAAFHRLDHWRRELGMPDDVFFASRPPRDCEAAADGKVYTHKPQYLSFRSGLLCDLLVETLRGHEGVLVFQEMLPSPEMLARRDGRPYATELILQLDRESAPWGREEG